MSTIIELLALSQARGPRQEAFIRELLGPEPVPYTPVEDYHTGIKYTVQYGATRLEHRSWVGLKPRLQAVGFSITRDYETKTLRMTFIGDVEFDPFDD